MKLYPNGIRILENLAYTTCVLSTADERKKRLNQWTLSGIIVVHVYHPYCTLTASHCAVSLEHPLRACIDLKIATSRNTHFLPPPRYTVFRIRTPRARKTNTED